jgi:hypothetical protein
VSPSSASHLVVAHGNPTLEIEVLDSNFATIESGVGSLDVRVPAGLYEVRFREGSEQESRLIKAEAGVTQELPLPEFEVQSAAPVAHTRTTHEHHEAAALEASHRIGNECLRAGPKFGGLIVMVRNVAGEDNNEFPHDLGRHLSLIRHTGTPVDRGERWLGSPDEGWALWSSAVPAGAYALRISGGHPRDEKRREATCQALWVDRRWQTTVFIPNTSEGPATDLASVHITQAGDWSPSDDGSTIAVALESVLAGLRQGRSVVPDDLTRLLSAKFVNPFLGIAAAHALLLDPNRSTRQLKTVIDNLGRLLPENPDVIALGHRARSVGAEVRLQQHVTWPPMMYAGYRALIRADATSPGVIADGSDAEHIAARVRLNGIWTTWAEPKVSRTRGTHRRSPVAASQPPTDSDDAATERLRTYVEGSAQVQAVSATTILNQRSLTELALATGLPSGAIRQAAKALRKGS